jgi:hypothetical protein
VGEGTTVGIAGPESATAGHLAVFADTSGQVLEDGGALPSTVPTATDSLQPIGVARATFNPSASSGLRSVGAHTFGGFTLPDKAIVVGGFVHVVTPFDSAGHSATLALSVESANDLVSALIVTASTWHTAGIKAITPKADAPETTGIVLTASRAITATVAIEALTVGKLVVVLYYVIGG